MSISSNAGGTDVLAWLHIGDLHLTTRDAENQRDLGRIVALSRFRLVDQHIVSAIRCWDGFAGEWHDREVSDFGER